MGRSLVFASLAHANYRRYFLAQTVSASGMWMQMVAETWLLVRLGGGGTDLGVAAALQFAPMLVLGAAGGVLVDRSDKRRLLLLTQGLLAVIAGTVGLLVWLDLVRIWTVWLAALLSGCVLAVDGPGRLAFSAELVPPELRANSVALNNAVGVSARAVGPAFSGLLIAGAGIALCFVANAVSYLAVMVALLRVEPAALTLDPAVPPRRGQVREGLRHVARDPALWTVLVMTAVVGVFGINFQLLLTLLVSVTFHAAAVWYGALMSSLGAGMILGSLLSAGRHRPTVSGVALLAAVFGATHALVGALPGVGAAMLGVFVLGAASGTFLASAAGVLQLHAGDGMRGRVMALYSVAFLGTALIGGPLMGWIADVAGPKAAFVIGGLCCIPAALVAVPAVRRAAAPGQRTP
jgi:MFS family permease